MNIELKYGDATVQCKISDTTRLQYLVPPQGAPVPSFEQALICSVESPVDAPPLSSLLSPRKQITIVVPDKTRQCILDRILPVLTRYLLTHRVPRENIVILFANGTHRLQTEEEMQGLLGSSIWENFRVEQHDSQRDENLVYVGTTSRGTKICINKLVAEAGLVITVGGILHHYFAGFGGGPKLIIPGVAGYETAKLNHRYTIDETGNFHPECREGNLNTNPVYVDIIEGVRYLRNIFAVNVVLDTNNNPVGFFSGDPVSSHRRGANVAAETYEVRVRERADLVIVSPGGAPRDSTFVQSHKAIHHAFRAVKSGGSIIAVAACDDGIGSDTFIDWFTIPYRSLGQQLRESYTLNGHTALSLRMKLRNTGISLLSELHASTVSHMGILPASSLQDAVDSILNELPVSPLVYVIPNGSLTVPVLYD